MKIKSFVGALGLCGLLGSAPAWSIPIETVGSIDNLVDSDNLGNSSTAEESSWVSGVLSGILGYDLAVTFDGKTECPAVGCDWEQVTGTGDSDVYAFELLDDPAYFLVKTGAGSISGDTHFLFENIGNLTYAVIQLSQMGLVEFTVTKISHITEFEVPTQVPEPGTLGLLGVGLLGMGLARRKRRNA